MVEALELVILWTDISRRLSPRSASPPQTAEMAEAAAKLAEIQCVLHLDLGMNAVGCRNAALDSCRRLELIHPLQAFRVSKSFDFLILLADN